jgi:very-short-patch-repair endonuclease
MRINNLAKYKIRRRKLRNNMTEAEIKIWCVLKSKSFHKYKFRRQHSIGVFIVDFYCPKLRLVIEIDGSQHLEAKNMLYDKRRTKYFNSLDIKVIRFFNNDILENIDGACMRIEDEINKLNN